MSNLEQEQSHIMNLMRVHSQNGRVDWIGLRPARREPIVPVSTATVSEVGLEGDHRARAGKRSVTLIQAEHLAVISAMTGRENVNPADLRRNIVVSGINLLALRNREFRIDDVILKGEGICAPCSRMEEAFGKGGYNAVRGHGGIVASVVKPGTFSIGDFVIPLEA